MRLNRLRNIWRLGTALAVFGVAAWLHGQNATSCAITGTVADATGAVVPGVQVTVTNKPRACRKPKPPMAPASTMRSRWRPATTRSRQQRLASKPR